MIKPLKLTTEWLTRAVCTNCNRVFCIPDFSEQLRKIKAKQIYCCFCGIVHEIHGNNEES